MASHAANGANAGRERMSECQLELARRMVAVLRAEPGCTATQLRRDLGGASDRDVRTALEANPNVFLCRRPGEQFGNYIATLTIAPRAISERPRAPRLLPQEEPSVVRLPPRQH